MASMGDLKIRIAVDVDLSFWQALKLRIAGGKYAEEYFRHSISGSVFAREYEQLKDELSKLRNEYTAVVASPQTAQQELLKTMRGA